MSEERKHYSPRLGRNFQDGDLLMTAEVKAVISANSGGRPVSSRNLSDLARTRGLTRERPGPRDVLYHYSEIKDIVVAPHRGRQMQDHPSPSALRQRAFKERQRVQQMGAS